MRIPFNILSFSNSSLLLEISFLNKSCLYIFEIEIGKLAILKLDTSAKIVEIVHCQTPVCIANMSLYITLLTAIQVDAPFVRKLLTEFLAKFLLFAVRTRNSSVNATSHHHCYLSLVVRKPVFGAELRSFRPVDGVSPSVFRCTSTCHGSATRYRSEMEMQVS